MSDDLPIGHIQWACSEEDGGPDVGVLLRLSASSYLWCGEITNSEAEQFGADAGRWHLVLHRGDRRLILAQVVDEYCAREAMDELAAAIRETIASERAAIVAWLRPMAPAFQPSMNSEAALQFAADAIERGDHIEQPGTTSPGRG